MERDPDTKTISLDDARRQFEDLLREATKGKTRAVIEAEGRPVAAIIPAADFEQLQRDDARRRKDFQIMAKIGEAFSDVPIEELEREVEKGLREVRAERRREREQVSPDS